jgi:hypothetical protein
MVPLSHQKGSSNAFLPEWNNQNIRGLRQDKVCNLPLTAEDQSWVESKVSLEWVMAWYLDLRRAERSVVEQEDGRRFSSDALTYHIEWERCPYR